MKKTSKRVALLALLVLGVLIAICAYADECNHKFEAGSEWGKSKEGHWIVYYDRCIYCHTPNPKPQNPVNGNGPMEPHEPSALHYDEKLKKDVITCTGCERVLKKQTHEHKHSKTISKKFSKAVKLNASQHTSYYIVEKECVCGDTKKITQTTKNSHTMKVKSVERKPKQNLIVTTKCCSAYGCNHTTTSYDPIDPSKPWMTPQ